MLTPTSSLSSMLRSVSSSSARRLLSSAASSRRLASTITSRAISPPSSSHTLVANKLPPRADRQFHSSPSPSQEADQSAPQQEMSSGEADIHSLLSKRFSPSHLQVQDVSGGCGSFYAIVVASKEFQGLNTVKQHRLVNDCLKDIIGGIHGLQLKTVATD